MIIDCVQKKTCSVCGEKHKAKGFCNTHYQNFKTTGSPFGKTNQPRRNSIVSFLDLIESIHLNENGCKIWPMGINSGGYGNYSITDVTYSAHRLLYITIHNRSYYGLVVRHKCDNRACVNIDHLEIGSQSDNLRDASKRKRLKFGIDNKMSIFTEDDVLKIRDSYPKKSTVILAKEYDTDPQTIRALIIGKNWKHVPGAKVLLRQNRAIGIKAPTSKLSEKQVLEIRSQFPDKTKAQLARDFGVGQPNIKCILERKTWRHI